MTGSHDIPGATGADVAGKAPSATGVVEGVDGSLRAGAPPPAGVTGDGDMLNASKAPVIQRTSTLWLARLALLLLLIVSWETSSGRLIEAYLVSSPSEISVRLMESLQGSDFYRHLSVTLQETALGFVLGATFGVLTGFLLGRLRILGSILDPFIQAFYSLPKIALAPLFVLWFGIGVTMKVMLAAVLVFFLVFWNALSGVRDVDPSLIDSARVMGANRRTLLTKVVAPSAMSQILIGLKLAVPYALIGAVVGELIAANRGLGYLIVRAVSQYDTAGVFSTLLVLMVLAAVLNEAVAATDKHLGRWKNRG